MYTRSQMETMSSEELNVIAQQKNKKRVASKEALMAQEVIWSRRFFVPEKRVVLACFDKTQLDTISSRFNEWMGAAPWIIK